MFSGGFKEAIEHSATFPEDSPEDFEVILEWVYTGFLKPPEVIDVVDGVAILSHYVYSTYALADKFGLESLMDRIITAHMKCEAQHNLIATFNAIETSYNTTPVGSPLRKYFAWLLFFIIYEGRYSNAEQTWPTESVKKILKENDDLFSDLLKLMRENTPGTRFQNPCKSPFCNFHCHKEGEPCIDDGKALDKA